MPQFQQLRKDQAKVRILSKDATRAYLLMMKHAAGKIQVLPDDLYVVDETIIQLLRDNAIEFDEFPK